MGIYGNANLTAQEQEQEDEFLKRMFAQTRNVYTPAQRTPEQMEAALRRDTDTAQRTGAQRHEDTRFKGRGLMGLVAPLVNRMQRDKRSSKFAGEDLTALTNARAGADAAAQRAGLQKSREAAFESGQDYQSEMRGARRDYGAQEDRQTHAVESATTANTRSKTAATLGNTRSKDAATEAYERANLKRDREVFHTVGAKDHNDVTSYGYNREGKLVDEYGDPVDVSRMTPWKPSTTQGSRSAATAYKEEDRKRESISAEAEKAVMESDLGQILMYDDLNEITGTFDVRRMLADKAPLTEGMEKDQSMLLKMRGVSLKSIAPVLDIMGVNPTDKDLEEAFKSGPTEMQGEQAWIDYVRDNIAPLARSKAIARMADTGKTMEEIDAAYNAMLKLADDAQQKHYGEEKPNAKYKIRKIRD